jgi:hypothetical protein
MRSSLTQALMADGPAADRRDSMQLYGFLVGRWRFDATVHLDVGTHHGTGEIYADWALEGRAIQDVWILPGVFYGTTLRVYDAGVDGWHILWSDPLRQYYTRQTGRARGRDIVQEGTDLAGATVRWSFTEVGADSFRWLGERREQDRRWAIQAEFRARRIG